LPLLCAGNTDQGQQGEQWNSELIQPLHILSSPGLGSSMGGFGRELQHLAATDETCEIYQNIRRKNLPAEGVEVNVAFLLLTSAL
jgi:hypothetical protein